MRSGCTAARARAALAAVGAVATSIGVACEPQEIYLFDRDPPASRVDAGVSRPPPSEPPDPPSAPPAPEPVDTAPPAPPLRAQPACLSSACDACVEQRACAVDGASLFCHPQTAACALACDPEAAGRAGNCPANQSCDPRLGLCVECVTNTDCAGALPVCDLSRNVCVECDDDAACRATGEVCLTALQRCVECRDDLDCRGRGDAVHCLPGEQRCVECVDDRDCTSDAEKPLCSPARECEDGDDDGGEDDD